MNENWFEWLLGFVVMLLAWLGKRLHDRLDDCVSREELNRSIDAMRNEQRERHGENRETLSRIHERVDALWERLAP